MKNRKLVLVAGLVAGMSITAIAQPVLKEIKAHFNPTIKYTLDGEEVLEGKGALVFEDKVYLPVRDASNVLGVDIDYKDQTVIFTTVTEEAAEVIEATKIEEAEKAEDKEDEEEATTEEEEATDEEKAATEEEETTEEETEEEAK